MSALLNPQTGAPLPAEALAYFQAKGWKIGFDYRDVWKQEHTAAFTVAKAMNLNILETIRTAVDGAMAEGIPFEQFVKTLQPQLENAGWWGKKPTLDPKTGDVVEAQLGSPHRLRIIYDTNLRVAHATGQWERMERTKDALPYVLYQLGPSAEHRPEHVKWNGTLLPLGHPWLETHAAPNGYGCKCWLRQVSRYAAEKLGGVTAAPPSHDVPWLNKRTGKVERVPVGIDPGWDFNPGKDRMRGPKEALKDAEAKE